MHEEIPQYHVHEALPEIEDRLDAGKDLHIHDTRECEKHEIVNACAAGAIVRDGEAIRVITYRGQDSLQTDRYEVIDI